MKHLKKFLGILAVLLLPMPLFGQLSGYSQSSSAGIPRNKTFTSVDYDYQTRTLMIMVYNAAGVHRVCEVKLKIIDSASGEEVFSIHDKTPLALHYPLMYSGLFQIVISLSSGEYYEAWIDTARYQEIGAEYECFMFSGRYR